MSVKKAHPAAQSKTKPRNPELAAYNEAGRRLQAAAISSLMGQKSVDYVLKTYVHEEVDDSWRELARNVTRVIAQQAGNPQPV